MIEGRHVNLSDNAIVQNLAGGGSDADEAIRHLYRSYFGLLSQYIMNNSGTADDAEDIFQEVIIAFINLVKAGKFRGESSVKTFLFSLNRNMWLNELKRRGRAQARETKYEVLNMHTEKNIQQAMEYQQSNKALMNVLERLGETCKKILLLFYYENLSMKEILSQTDYENEQVVRNKKSNCLKKLEQIISSNKSLHQQLKTLLNG